MTKFPTRGDRKLIGGRWYPRAVPELNDGMARIALSNGRAEGRDFVRVIDWPGGLDRLRYAGEEFGAQRANDPRFFPCCACPGQPNAFTTSREMVSIPR